MQEDNNIVTWAIGLLLTALTTLVGTVVALSRIIESGYKKQITDFAEHLAKLDEEVIVCRREREASRVAEARLQAQNDILKEDQEILRARIIECEKRQSNERSS